MTSRLVKGGPILEAVQHHVRSEEKKKAFCLRVISIECIKDLVSFCQNVNKSGRVHSQMEY